MVAYFWPAIRTEGWDLHQKVCARRSFYLVTPLLPPGLQVPLEVDRYNVTLVVTVVAAVAVG